MEKAGLITLSPPYLSLPTSRNFVKTNVARRKSPPIKNSTADEEKITIAEEIRVCTNRTCRRQGSLDILQILSGISPPSLSVNSCGCLGRCGAGPNVVVLPQGAFVSHCGTPSKAGHLMVSLACSFDGDDKEFERSCRACLEALALRKRGEDEMEKGHLDEALLLLSQVLDNKEWKTKKNNNLEF